MKHLPNIAGGLLGLLFVMAGVTVLLKLGPTPPAPPEGSAAALFMRAFVPTGYLTFVKVLEILGGLLVAIPRTRNFGLLILGPIIVNILAFHIFITKGEGLFAVPIILIVVLATYLMWVARSQFAALGK